MAAVIIVLTVGVIGFFSLWKTAIEEKKERDMVPAEKVMMSAGMGRASYRGIEMYVDDASQMVFLPVRRGLRTATDLDDLNLIAGLMKDLQEWGAMFPDTKITAMTAITSSKRSSDSLVGLLIHFDRLPSRVKPED